MLDAVVPGASEILHAADLREHVDAVRREPDLHDRLRAYEVLGSDPQLPEGRTEGNQARHTERSAMSASDQSSVIAPA